MRQRTLVLLGLSATLAVVAVVVIVVLVTTGGSSSDKESQRVADALECWYVRTQNYVSQLLTAIGSQSSSSFIDGDAVR